MLRSLVGSEMCIRDRTTSGQLVDIQTVIQRMRDQISALQAENAELRGNLGTCESRPDNAQLGAERERDFYQRRCAALEAEIEGLRNLPTAGSTHRVVFHSEQVLDGYTTFGYPTKAEHYRPIAQPLGGPPVRPAIAPPARPAYTAPAPAAPAPAPQYGQNRGTRGFASRIRKARDGTL
eukprot:TRINITY_DN9643_c0_g1_i1.p1 TRINITY_DN9643_c0_g1~~TRINITY_DN9643_c0_g1_i1.p1  ORF type:complete len:179 (-),score=47.37 TRINITY_DN9643_c0_g1_i1:158-694(-)